MIYFYNEFLEEIIKISPTKAKALAVMLQRKVSFTLEGRFCIFFITNNKELRNIFGNNKARVDEFISLLEHYEMAIEIKDPELLKQITQKSYIKKAKPRVFYITPISLTIGFLLTLGKHYSKHKNHRAILNSIATTFIKSLTQSQTPSLLALLHKSLKQHIPNLPSPLRAYYENLLTKLQGNIKTLTLIKKYTKT